MSEFRYVGKSIPRIDAKEKVLGQTKFGADFKVPGMLYAKLVTSPYPHAKILKVDTSEAEKVPGVRAVITSKDTPEPEVLCGLMRYDRPVIPRDKVRYVGETVAAVAADTIEIAEEAADLIKVDYEELPAVFDTEEAMKKEPATVIHPDSDKYVDTGLLFWPAMETKVKDMPNCYFHLKFREGDVDKGFQEADLVIENRYYTAKTLQATPEPHMITAWWEPDGTLVMQSKSQVKHMCKGWVASYFGLPLSKVKHYSKYCGGAFGGSACWALYPIPALLAKKAGKPVQLVLTRAEDCIFVQRPCDIIEIKDGVKKDGTLVARKVKWIIDNGAYCNDWDGEVPAFSFTGAMFTYRIPNLHADFYGVYTNKPACSVQRGVENPQFIFAVESQMDMLAEKLGLGAVEIREKNILREGERTAGGEALHSIGVRDCLAKTAQWIEWGKKPVAEPGPWKKGKGIAIGGHPTVGGTAGVARVRILADGNIAVGSGADEVGQGTYTAMAQIAAEAFGIPVERIQMEVGDTDTPIDSGAYSSRQTFYAGGALLRACEDAKRQLFELAAPRLMVAPDELETKDGKVYTKGAPGWSIPIAQVFHPMGWATGIGEIVGRGIHLPPCIPWDGNGHSERFDATFAYGSYAVEVAVNVDTGEIKVLRVAGCFDAGQPINPKMCEGQIEGGMAMGIGNGIYEEAVIERGVTLNPSYVDYKLPSVMEVPTGENCAAFMTTVAPHRDGPYGAKGFGEMTLVAFMPAVANAVYNATGVRICELPLSRQRVWRALREKKAKGK